MKAQFPLASPRNDIERTKGLYVFVLGAKQGSSADGWLDINLYDNQLTFTEAGSFNFYFKTTD
ncbi:MAG: extradiol dioxygenase family protein [Ulvibacter sp.]|jgi:extradiol dioxygenase family protein|tara:strand:+ start:1041 stop:1229 length:189 start_codon:yes stop_codon:yes gene_type:complete